MKRKLDLFDKLKKGVYTVPEVGIQTTVNDVIAAWENDKRNLFALPPEPSTSQLLSYQTMKEAWDALTAKPILPMFFSSKYDPAADFLSFFRLKEDPAPTKGPWLETIT